MDKSVVLKSFNNLFFSFLDDIITIFPENDELNIARTSFETIKKFNVTAILKAWHYFVYTPYKDEILNSDISFFINKNYNNDLTYLSNSDEIIRIIDKFREPIRKMSNENKDHSMNYIQKLSQLSDIYMNLGLL